MNLPSKVLAGLFHENEIFMCISVTSESIPIIKFFLLLTLTLAYMKLLGFILHSFLLFMEIHSLMESEISFRLPAITLLFAQLSFGDVNIEGE